MLDLHGYPVVGQDNLDDFLQQHEDVVLFFTDLAKPLPETADVAVILPELAKAFPGRFTVAVVAHDEQHKLHKRYRFRTWPTLVFLRHGQYLGAVSKVQDWSVYLQEIEAILASEPSEPPRITATGAGLASSAG
ncbi:MAG: hypothetical protein QNJ40_08040 [Xanthomonadales bacterium]|nr:hypothetical protein [Xanthomonadales bacterium]